MTLIELLLVAIGLSMDAFAVSLSKGLCMKKLNYRHALIISAFFGGFQAMMPLAGWLLGRQFEHYISIFSHWIAFILLAFIGGKMLREAIKGNNDASGCMEKLDIRELAVLALATSIDALAVGVTFAFLQVSILPSIALIGITTFILCMIGVAIGNRFGMKFKSKAEIFGGIVLILIGTEILLEHLNIF